MARDRLFVAAHDGASEASRALSGPILDRRAYERRKQGAVHACARHQRLGVCRDRDDVAGGHGRGRVIQHAQLVAHGEWTHAERRGDRGAGGARPRCAAVNGASGAGEARRLPGHGEQRVHREALVRLERLEPQRAGTMAHDATARQFARDVCYSGVGDAQKDDAGIADCPSSFAADRSGDQQAGPPHRACERGAESPLADEGNVARIVRCRRCLSAHARVLGSRAFCASRAWETRPESISSQASSAKPFTTEDTEGTEDCVMFSSVASVSSVVNRFSFMPVDDLEPEVTPRRSSSSWTRCGCAAGRRPDRPPEGPGCRDSGRAPARRSSVWGPRWNRRRAGRRA